MCICEQLCNWIQAVAGYSPKKGSAGKNPSLAGSINPKVEGTHYTDKIHSQS